MKLLLLLLSSILSGPFVPAECRIPAIINFGDSNSDTGGSSASLGPVPPPYGETFFTKPAGRLSDGRLIIDFMAESFGFPHLSAYLDSLGADFRHGANFAFSGSTITTLNCQDWNNPVSLDVQLRQFLQFKSRVSGEKLLPTTTRDYFSRAFYTFDIGQNDLTAGYVRNKSAHQFIPEALSGFSAAVKSIYHEGGRHFWIHNTGPLGCLPPILLSVPLAASQLDSAGCGIPANKLAQRFNRMLNETVFKLRNKLPLAEITYVDIYSLKYTLIKEPEKHGFEKPLQVCCGFGGGEYNYNPSVPCGFRGDLPKPCEDPSKRISWDGIHYTEAANKWVFDQICTGAFSDPRGPLLIPCRKANKAALNVNVRV